MKMIAAALVLAVATPAVVQAASVDPATTAVAAKGKMLVAADGARLAPIYRVAADGAQLIVDGRMITVPNSTISMVNGKLTTSLTKTQVIALQ